MYYYALKRLGVAIAVAITVSIVTFTLLRLSGDPAAALAGDGATEQDIEYVRKYYGFDRPLIVQYWDWATDAMQGNFGRSAYLKMEVADIIFERLPVTMKLGGFAVLFAFFLSIPLGVLAAVYPNTVIDRTALSIAVVGQAMPPFFFALILMYWLGIEWRLLPISGTDSWKHFVMPACALGYYVTPPLMRLTRAGMLDVLASDYIRTARAKGLRPMSVLFKHALRNAIIPVVSLAAVLFGYLLGGSIVIEAIFTVHGVGLLAWESIARSDFEVMQAVVLILACIFIALTLVADLLNAFLDPRIRVTESG